MRNLNFVAMQSLQTKDAALPCASQRPFLNLIGDFIHIMKQTISIFIYLLLLFSEMLPLAVKKPHVTWERIAFFYVQSVVYPCCVSPAGKSVFSAWELLFAFLTEFSHLTA
jgi:hypothetical protein